MSDKCPLCGNERWQDSLFCVDCTKKVQSDYEVMLPESVDNATEINIKTKTESIDYITEPDVEINKSISEEAIVESVYVKSEDYPDNKNKKRNKLLRTALVILVLVGSYFVFYEVVLEKLLSFRMGLTKDAMYRLKVTRSR